MKERIRHLILAIALVLIDQLSKYWVRTNLISKDVVIINDVLRLQYHTNTGAVWGILTGKTLFLSIFTAVLLLLILFFYFKIPKDKKYSALKLTVVFIAAGAVGNLIDRICLGYVTDFIYFELINFPLFNFADSCLTVSSIVLFILAVFYYSDDDLMFIYRIFGRKKDTGANTEEKAGEIVSDSPVNNNEENPDK